MANVRVVVAVAAAGATEEAGMGAVGDGGTRGTAAPSERGPAGRCCVSKEDEAARSVGDGGCDEAGCDRAPPAPGAEWLAWGGNAAEADAEHVAVFPAPGPGEASASAFDVDTVAVVVGEWTDVVVGVNDVDVDIVTGASVALAPVAGTDAAVPASLEEIARGAATKRGASGSRPAELARDSEAVVEFAPIGEADNEARGTCGGPNDVGGTARKGSGGEAEPGARGEGV